MRGAALQQAVAEPAGRGADVQRAAAGDVEPQRVQRVGELHAAARDEARLLVDGDDHVGLDHLAGLGRAPALVAHQHLAGQDGRGGACAGVEQPAIGEQCVEADLRHPDANASGPQVISLTVGPAPARDSRDTMTAFRLVPLHLHGALELLVGLALMAAPFALGLSSAAVVAGLAAGAVVAGLRALGRGRRRPRRRRPLRLRRRARRRAVRRRRRAGLERGRTGRAGVRHRRGDRARAQHDDEVQRETLRFRSRSADQEGMAGPPVHRGAAADLRPRSRCARLRAAVPRP